MSAPTPGELKTMVAAVFDRAADTYDHVGVDYFTLIAGRLVELVAPRPGDRVLDVGCGRGAAAFAAAEAVGPEGYVLGIDLAPGMVRHAMADAKGLGHEHVTIRLGDAEAPDLSAEEPFDAVLASLVVFFLPDPAAALGNYRAALREGGRLGVTTFPPQAEPVWSKVTGLLERHLPGKRGVNRPTSGPLASPEAFEAALREAGFREVEIRHEWVDTSFADVDAWWTWAWSQGQRAALERVPEGDLEAFRQECYDTLRPATEPDGSLRLRQHVTYTVATA